MLELAENLPSSGRRNYLLIQVLFLKISLHPQAFTISAGIFGTNLSWVSPDPCPQTIARLWHRPCHCSSFPEATLTIQGFCQALSLFSNLASCCVLVQGRHLSLRVCCFRRVSQSGQISSLTGVYSP